MSYKDQGIFFLNAYPELIEKYGEDTFEQVKVFEELDGLQGKPKGRSLERFFAAQFLERIGAPITQTKFTQEFSKIDLDFDKKMSLLEYVVYFYDEVDMDTLTTRPQETEEEPKELTDAIAAVTAVQAEISAIEAKKAKLEKKIEKKTGVKQMRAKNELAQLLDADPLELNRAIITAEAALRKVKKMLKKKGGSGGGPAQGKIYWMEMEVAEAKSYKPKGDRRRVSKWDRK